MIRVCVECGRRFDLTVEEDADEWAHGHDCEEDFFRAVVGTCVLHDTGDGVREGCCSRWERSPLR